MRFGFSDGSCGSVRGSWRFQSPRPKSLENNTFWGSTQFGSLGPEACEKGTPTRAAEKRGGAGGVHNSGVWGLELAKKGAPKRAAGEGSATRRNTQFGSLGPDACEKGTRVLLGRGSPRGGVHNSGVWGLKLAKHACCWGGARYAGSTQSIRELGA